MPQSAVICGRAPPRTRPRGVLPAPREPLPHKYWKREYPAGGGELVTIIHHDDEEVAAFEFIACTAGAKKKETCVRDPVPSAARLPEVASGLSTIASFWEVK